MGNGCKKIGHLQQLHQPIIRQETVRLADQKAAVGKAALEVIPIGRAPPPSRESREDAFPCQQRDNITVDVADLKRKRAEAAREMPLRWRCRALSLPHG